MNKEKIVKDCIELVKRFDSWSNSDCEDEGVVSSEFGTIGVGVFAVLRDCYFNGYSSNKDVSNKEVFTDEEINLLQEIVKQCINKAIDYDVLKQAEKIFDKVIILQSGNGKSKGELLWNTDILGELNSVLNNYEVHNISKLITDDLKSFSHLGNVTLIRGLRNGSDLLYEQNYIQTLRDIDPNINVSYFLTKPEYAHVSSSMIRELLKIDPVLAKKYLQY